MEQLVSSVISLALNVILYTNVQNVVNNIIKMEITVLNVINLNALLVKMKLIIV